MEDLEDILVAYLQGRGVYGRGEEGPAVANPHLAQRRDPQSHGVRAIAPRHHLEILHDANRPGIAVLRCGTVGPSLEQDGRLALARGRTYR